MLTVRAKQQVVGMASYLAGSLAVRTRLAGPVTERQAYTGRKAQGSVLAAEAAVETQGKGSESHRRTHCRSCRPPRTWPASWSTAAGLISRP